VTQDSGSKWAPGAPGQFTGTAVINYSSRVILSLVFGHTAVNANARKEIPVIQISLKKPSSAFGAGPRGKSMGRNDAEH